MPSHEDAAVTVLIADDHPVYRRGLARAIKDQPDFELVAEEPDGQAALASIERLEPDVAVLDVSMPGLEGHDVVAALGESEATRVLLLSGGLHQDGAYGALAAGAKGYLLKTAEHEAICEAIRTIAAGGSVIAPELHGELARQIQAREQEQRPLLTERELQILRMTASGAGAAAIAEELFLSVATVRTHIQNVHQKLGVSDRAAAVATGMRLGLIR